MQEFAAMWERDAIKIGELAYVLCPQTGMKWNRKLNLIKDDATIPGRLTILGEQAINKETRILIDHVEAWASARKDANGDRVRRYVGAWRRARERIDQITEEECRDLLREAGLGDLIELDERRQDHFKATRQHQNRTRIRAGGKPIKFKKAHAHALTWVDHQAGRGPTRPQTLATLKDNLSNTAKQWEKAARAQDVEIPGSRSGKHGVISTAIKKLTVTDSNARR
jgi:hypothetical protein